MVDSSTHHTTHISWFELVEFGLSIGIALLVIILFFCFYNRFRVSGSKAAKPFSMIPMDLCEKHPECMLIMLALPLQLLWEVAQFPLYTVWHEGDWAYILYGLIHCTLGDLLILLVIFWVVSLLNKSRFWVYESGFTSFVLFIFLGLVYTIYSEIVNTRIKGTWGYTESMPIVPVIEIGGAPFMQWLLIPPVLIWLMRLLQASRMSRPV